MRPIAAACTVRQSPAEYMGSVIAGALTVSDPALPASIYRSILDFIVVGGLPAKAIGRRYPGPKNPDFNNCRAASVQSLSASG